MGLDIVGEHTDKHICWSYGGLHRIRELALRACSVSTGFARFTRQTHSGQDLVRCLVSNYPELQVTDDDLYGLRLAGYYFPNLLFHSDCDGTYTSRGKVMSDTSWTTGNIRGLFSELMLVKKEIEDLDVEEMELHMLDQFIELVEDELKYKRPIIYFN